MSIIAVTGSASGIGAAVCQQLIDKGHTVIGIDLRADQQFTHVAADLSQPQGRQAAIEHVQSLCNGQLDGLVCCAGLGVTAPSSSLIIGVNYFGAAALVQGLLPQLQNSKQSSVVIIGSVAANQQLAAPHEMASAMLDNDETQARALADTAQAPHIAYAASKYAITAWARAEAVKQGAGGVRINIVAPGAVETPLHKASKEDPRFGEAVRNFIAPIGRAGQPTEIAATVSFLLSTEASFITGSVLFVDGGMDAMMRSKHF